MSFLGISYKKYKLAISHLVAQHTSNSDLLNELILLRKHLDTQGLIKIQFAFPYKITKNNYIKKHSIVDGIEKLKSGSNIKEMGEILKLTALYSLSVHDLTVVNYFPDSYMVHVIVTFKRFKPHTENYNKFKNFLKRLFLRNDSILE